VATSAPLAPSHQTALVSRGVALEKLTIAWNAAEAVAAIASGLAARSIALTGFGFDSVIEIVAAVALYARLRAEARGAGRVGERTALRVVGIAFFLLTAYVLVDSAATLWSRAAPRPTLTGVAVALLAVIVMPLLARAKLRVGEAIDSPALVADAKCSLACAWLSVTVLLGVGLNAAFGWWWADPLAALAMIPLLVREGREAIERSRGKPTSCGCHGECA